jgi:DNA-binding NtrC family response regulator
MSLTETLTTLAPPASGRPHLKQLVDDYERRLIRLALEACHGSQRRAAETLGVLPSTLSEKMKRLGLRESGARAPQP